MINIMTWVSCGFIWCLLANIHGSVASTPMTTASELITTCHVVARAQHHFDLPVSSTRGSLTGSIDDFCSNGVYIPRGGGGFLPAGWNPFGFKITELGQRYLAFQGSLDSDVGRFLASLKTRKTAATIKAQWIEIVKVSKQGQSMRIYRMLDDLIQFCLAAGFID